jgi:hypothetical protein
LGSLAVVILVLLVDAFDKFLDVGQLFLCH